VVEISGRDQLTTFLEGKPVEWARVIAVRAAMRILPVWRTPEGRSDLTMAVFRALFISQTMSLWPSRQISLAAISAAAAAEAAAYFAADTGYATAAYASAYAAEAAAEMNASAYAVRAAACSIAVRGDSAEGDLWRQIGRDAEALLTAGNDTEIAQAVLVKPLWTGAGSSRMTKGWPALSSNLLSRKHEAWEIWVDWYDGAFAGQPTIFSGLASEVHESFCVQLAVETEAFWARDAAAINTDIKDRLEALRVAVIPKQLFGPLVTFERDGKVARQLPSPPDDLKGNLHSAREALVESIDDFEAAFPSHNHSGLRQALVRLRMALGADYQQLDIIRAG